MADANVNITPGSGASIDARTTPGGDLRQVVALGNDGDTVSGVSPWGALDVNTGPSTLFYDSWSTSPIDTADKWTVTGTAPTIAGGNMTMAATAGYHAIRTKDVVRPNAAFTYVANGIQLEGATPGTGATRFWGLGTPATTPSATSMAQEGAGFEVDAAGALHAVLYTGGVRTSVATLTRPTDGLTHRYAMYFRVTGVMWHIDDLQIPVASRSFPAVALVELPALIARFNATPTGVTFTNIAHLTADTARQGVSIIDPIIGTRTARVTAGGAFLVDRSAPETFGTAAGNIYVARATPSTVLGSTVLQAAPAAGLSLYLTDVSVSNAGATLNIVTFLNGATGVLDVVAAANGGGGTVNLQTPIKLTAATALNYTTSAASDTRITVTGYTAA